MLILVHTSTCLLFLLLLLSQPGSKLLSAIMELLISQLCSQVDEDNAVYKTEGCTPLSSNCLLWWQDNTNEFRVQAKMAQK